MNRNVRVIARDGDTETDVTEGVQALYDLVLSSMDWGSGFLSYEDAVPVAKIARVCGFEKADEAERYLREQQHSDEQEQFLRAHSEAYRMPAPPHDHFFSSAGKCMWRGCIAKDAAAASPPGT